MRLIPAELLNGMTREECGAEVRGWIATVEVKDLKSVATATHGNILAVWRDADAVCAIVPCDREGRHVVDIAGCGKVAVRIRRVARKEGGAKDKAGIVWLAVNPENGSGEVVRSVGGHGAHAEG